MSSSINDQILANRQETWKGFTRLLFWGTLGCAIVTAIAVAFTL